MTRKEAHVKVRDKLVVDLGVAVQYVACLEELGLLKFEEEKEPLQIIADELQKMRDDHGEFKAPTGCITVEIANALLRAGWYFSRRSV